VLEELQLQVTELAKYPMIPDPRAFQLRHCRTPVRLDDAGAMHDALCLLKRPMTEYCSDQR
jgi:hypothetical protein